MTSIFQDPVFAAYALSAAVVVVTLYALSFLTAKTRADRKVVLNAEDAAINGGAKVADAEHPDVARVQRAHRNLVENALPFFAIGFLYTMTAPSLTLARALFAVFALARVAHAVFYLQSRQPWRTISYALAALANLTMVVQVARAVVAHL